MSERAAEVPPTDADEQDDDQISDSATPDAATGDTESATETTPRPVTNGAQSVVRALENAGVEYAFGAVSYTHL
ncbi:acetolactate synthase large subunit [Natronorubrum bangense JCM 10635]|uniref:Acetolactate synthase large subunit n=1 Tax=Natronorubrum bangense JCM 10635 TaxID=1227500 RepID=L9WRB6_9EURY|nr:acetolactate synthase large subunit [Natronorubrum bangense JCM 10635]